MMSKRGQHEDNFMWRCSVQLVWKLDAVRIYKLQKSKFIEMLKKEYKRCHQNISAAINSIYVQEILQAQLLIMKSVHST